VFLRGHNESGKEFLEFATVLNVGGGGALVASRQDVLLGTHLSIEIPVLPEISASAQSVPSLLSKCKRNFTGILIHMLYTHRYYLMALKFTRPLISPFLATKKASNRN
jgi:hypothetical protein